MLAEHKQAQKLKFGPSFWYRHQSALSIALVLASPVVGAIVGAIEGFTPQTSALTIGSSFVWMCMVALITGTGLIRLRGGSHWEERVVSASFLADADVPEPIAKLARSLLIDVPGSTLILGELKREEVVLDPYLLLDDGDETRVPGNLGEWPGDRLRPVGCRAEQRARIPPPVRRNALRCSALRWNPHRQRPDAVDKVGIDPPRFAHHLDHRIPGQHFLPQDAKLQFGQPVADAAMNAKAE